MKRRHHPAERRRRDREQRARTNCRPLADRKCASISPLRPRPRPAARIALTKFHRTVKRCTRQPAFALCISISLSEATSTRCDAHNSALLQRGRWAIGAVRKSSFKPRAESLRAAVPNHISRSLYPLRAEVSVGSPGWPLVNAKGGHCSFRRSRAASRAADPNSFRPRACVKALQLRHFDVALTPVPHGAPTHLALFISPTRR